MRIKLGKQGLNLIEFFLSIVALLLLFMITYPILQQLIERSETAQIKENLNQILSYSDQYFEEHATNSVSLFEFIGPRKVIPVLEIVADEEYPVKIFRNKEMSAQSKKYGVISVQ